jgi:hypothetical protein
LYRIFVSLSKKNRSQIILKRKSKIPLHAQKVFTGCLQLLDFISIDLRSIN